MAYKPSKTLDSDNIDDIKKVQEELQQASYKLSEEMYKASQAGAQQQQQQGAPGEDAGGAKKDEDVVDADFKVDEDKDKK